MVNKALLVQKIAELVKDKKIHGIVDVTDQSNMEGIRVCIDVRRDANPNVILNTASGYIWCEYACTRR